MHADDELLTIPPATNCACIHCREYLMTAEQPVQVSQEQERVLQLGASDFLLLILAVLALFVVLPKLAYRYASSKASSKRD